MSRATGVEEHPTVVISRPTSPAPPSSSTSSKTSQKQKHSTHNPNNLSLNLTHLPAPLAKHAPAADQHQYLAAGPSHERMPLLSPGNIHNHNNELLSIEIDRPSTPVRLTRDWVSHPQTSAEQEYEELLAVTPGGHPSFVAQPRGTPPTPTFRSRIRLFFTQLMTNGLSAVFLIGIVVWALTARTISAIPGILFGPEDQKYDWDNPQKWKNEKLVKDPAHYAENCGYRIVHQQVETEDGYYLRIHKVIVPAREHLLKSDGRGGYPVIIQHGLFQTSGSFVTSEERSLAFWLAEHGGYQVYLSNNRGVFDMGHRQIRRSDPRFWDYNIRELALYDLPAVVDHVKRETGYDTVAFIGHSQGNATMFCTLAQGMLPQLGSSLSLFIALAPAVYAGPLTTGFPFNLIKSLDWKQWKRLFGVLDFIPLMRIAYDYTPGYFFGLLGYQMFAFLFTWTDRHCLGLSRRRLKRRKPKMFRFTPSPVSSAGIFWWTGLNGFSTKGCVLDTKVGKWFDKRFPPLSLYYGGHDYLVLVEPLIERLATNESDVRVIRVDKLETGEHCDSFWAADAVEQTFWKIKEDIERCRPRYPEELTS